ncbi:tubulin specific chaperone cofactor B [Fusarium heterosporum]|uniref:Tubulin specific chaperone cofactor B n=1 Tax=Fusarium heterosporum TaxID=42747 RepID=A0A8H5TXD0_FUSHE|nr:tubulin specific chaperone cofactor B [Fusarium heterosporum]
MADVPLVVIAEFAQSERRITPSWSISQLKTKLETVTGVPPSCQRLSLKPTAGAEAIAIEAANEDDTHLSNFPLAPYAELHPTGVPSWRPQWLHSSSNALDKADKGSTRQVIDTRPAASRINLNDTANVDKYVMPEEEYEKKTDSVLAWKKDQKLGRFDPNAPSHEQAKLDALDREVATRGIAVGRRCRVGGEDTRRGVIQYVGEVKEIPGGLGTWVAIKLDEPVGKNDGSIAGTRYWGEPSELKHGVFVRPERVEAGDFPALDDLEDMEEI